MSLKTFSYNHYFVMYDRDKGNERVYIQFRQATRIDMNQIFDLDTLFKVTVYVKKKLNSNQTVLHTRAPKLKQFDLIYAQMKMFRGSFDFR